VGAFDEVGPIAREVQVVPLPPDVSGERLRLRITRGHWRLGTSRSPRSPPAATPIRLAPVSLPTDHGDARAAAAWLAGERPALVTGPGDSHHLTYVLPDDPERLELFLQSRGYYLEWMREQWLAEESPRRPRSSSTSPRAPCAIWRRRSRPSSRTSRRCSGAAGMRGAEWAAARAGARLRAAQPDAAVLAAHGRAGAAQSTRRLDGRHLARRPRDVR
jgi:hypothetical protein